MSTQVAQGVHGGRGMTAWSAPLESDETKIGWPEMAYESIRAINRLTCNQPIPPPVLHHVLGNPKRVGHFLPQVLDQLGHGLLRSLAEFDVYDSAGDPAANVEQTRASLQDRRSCGAGARRGAGSCAVCRRIAGLSRLSRG